MKKITKILSAFGPFLGLIFVYALFFIIAPYFDAPSFGSLLNTKTILAQTVIFGIGALGLTFVIIGDGIDLSAGSVVALGTVITALILKKFGGDHAGVFITLLAALGGIAACGACGFINGITITGLRIVPFIVTLGMMQIGRGAALGFAGQMPVNVPDSWLKSLMVAEPQMGVWYSIAPAVWIMLILLIVCSVILKYTVFGRYVFAVGSNESTARLCGINVPVLRIVIYSLAGLLVGVASVMQFSNLNQGDPSGAVGMELDFIAAVVIGGGSLSGGAGSAGGSIIGALIMAVLRNGCNMVGVPNYVQNIVVGFIIVAAVGLDRFKSAKQA
ncbi:TPA: cyclic nucleotide-binding protein [Candidatus Sumerlaeota bacterium]|jgi:ribose/xylose/arabinose/galactoside ABC-type transport system permease subunit|nr:cyclic nucleotide-binding protein [Candidatus Sumerlaeota bacterium]